MMFFNVRGNIIFLLTFCLIITSHATAQNTKSSAQSTQHLISTLNKLLQQQNQQLLADRLRIDRIAQHYLNNDDISEDDFNWLKTITHDYQLAPQQRGDKAYFNALLHRVDVIPASLAIAQALLETDRSHTSSAQKANNPFGLLCQRPCQQQLMRFPTQQAAITYYIHLLNTAKAYEPLRKLRAQARKQQQKLRGEQLANGLIHYSLQGRAYSDKLQQTIKTHHLTKLD